MAGNSKKKNVWISENLDRINLTVIKGKKDVIRAHAEGRGESVNGFINRAIESMLEQDKQGQMPKADYNGSYPVIKT